MITSVPAGEIPPVDLIGAARAHWLSFSAPIVLSVAGAIALWCILPNRYTAEAVVALDARKIQVITLDSVVSRLPQDSPVLRTELDLIASRSMAGQVVDRLGLLDAPPAPEKQSWGWWPWRRLKSSAGDGPELSRSPRAAAIDRLVSGLRVNNDGRSYTIFIYFDAGDPEFAAKAANAYATTYLEHQIAIQAQATRNASDWLGSKVADLGARLEASEEVVENFRRSAGLLEANGGSAEGQRLAGINAELAAARSQRAGAEARVAAARELSTNGASNVSFSEVLNSPPIQALRANEAEIRRDIGEIQASGAIMSADLPAQKTRLIELERQIDGEVARVIASLASEVDVARRKETALEGEVAKVEAEVSRDSAGRVRLSQLQREAAANRTIYESFLNRYKQTIEQQGLANPDATLLSSAETPMQPAGPKLLPMLALGLIAGAMGGAGLATFRRQLTLRHAKSLRTHDETAERGPATWTDGSWRPIGKKAG